MSPPKKTAVLTCKAAAAQFLSVEQHERASLKSDNCEGSCLIYYLSQ